MKFLMGALLLVCHLSLNAQGLNLDIEANVKEAFLLQLNDMNSAIRLKVEQFREDNQDGRNMDGGFPTQFSEAEIKVTLISRYENRRIRCSIDGDRLNCLGTSEDHTYLVSISQSFCHNSGCDETSEDFLYLVKAGYSSVCEGTADQDPYTDDICRYKEFVGQFQETQL